MGNLDCQGRADDELVLLARASLVSDLGVSSVDGCCYDALLPVEDYFVSPQSEVIEYLRIRSGPDARPTDLLYAPSTSAGDALQNAPSPGYYEVGTNRLFIDKPITRSDLALYQIADLRRIGVLA